MLSARVAVLMALPPVLALGALAFQTQATPDAVVINISPTMFFVSLGVIAMTGLIGVMKFTNWMTTWMTKIEAAVGEIPQLRLDRHQAKEDVLVLRSRVDAVDKWIDGQEEDDRTLRVAMAEYINDRRQGERRAAGGPA